MCSSPPPPPEWATWLTQACANNNNRLPDYIIKAWQLSEPGQFEDWVWKKYVTDMTNQKFKKKLISNGTSIIFCKFGLYARPLN